MEKQEYQIMFDVETKHWWYRGNQYLLKNQIKNYLKSKRDLKILDAGCGTGANLTILREFGKTYGIDISPLAIKYCQKRGLKNIRQGSILKLPFKNNLFDLITCFSVLYHKKVSQNQKALFEIKRVLKRGGFLIGLEPALKFLQSEHDKKVHTGQRYTKNEIKNLLKKTGLKIHKISYLHFFVLPLIFLKRKVFQNVLPSLKKSSDLSIPPKILNQLLFLVLKFESRVLEFVDFPFGNSIFFVAQKNENERT